MYVYVLLLGIYRFCFPGLIFLRNDVLIRPSPFAFVLFFLLLLLFLLLSFSSRTRGGGKREGVLLANTLAHDSIVVSPYHLIAVNYWTKVVSLPPVPPHHPMRALNVVNASFNIGTSTVSITRLTRNVGVATKYTKLRHKHTARLSVCASPPDG